MVRAQGIEYDYDIKSIKKESDSSIIMVGGVHYIEGVLFRSEDKGEKWFAPEKIAQKRLNTFEIIEDKMFTSDHEGVIYRSKDNGSSWEQYQTPHWRDIKDISFVNADTGFAVGAEVFSRGLIYRTFNGGNKWSLCHDTLKPSLNFVYVKAQEIYAGGYGIVIKSYDMGTSWDTLIIVGDNWQGAFTLNNETYFYGLSGKLVKENGDNVYSPSALFRPAIGWRSHVKNEHYIILFGIDGRMLLSDDNGQSWSLEKTNLKQELHSGIFVSNNSGIIVGEEGAVGFFEIGEQ